MLMLKEYNDISEIDENMSYGNFSDNIGDLCGKCFIYFLYNNADELVYIGMTKKLLSRIEQHFTSEKKRGNNKDFCNVKYILVKESEMAKLEEQLITIYRPKYNIRKNRHITKEQKELNQYCGITDHTYKYNYLRARRK